MTDLPSDTDEPDGTDHVRCYTREEECDHCRQVKRRVAIVGPNGGVLGFCEDCGPSTSRRRRQPVADLPGLNPPGRLAIVCGVLAASGGTASRLASLALTGLPLP